MQSKLFIPYVEFYITNVCNLACDGCNRFNNYKFTGWQKWSDYAEIYRQWGQDLNPGSIGILGGEPMLNPTFLQWIKGIREIWPDPIIRIISNGFYLHKISNFYEHLVNDARTQLWVGIHNKKDKEFIINQVKSFLTGVIDVEYKRDGPYQEYLYLKDSKGVRVKVEYNWWFHQGALVNTADGLTLHTSDSVKSHAICHMKTCHHFVRGKLYKCGVVAVLPDFDQQHNLKLTTEDKDLIYSYKPLEVTETLDEKMNFIAKLDQPIPQCKFCPETYRGRQIFAQEKKVLFHR